jgi:hypothetical protein
MAINTVVYTITTVPQDIIVNARFLVLQNIGTNSVWFSIGDTPAAIDSCFGLPVQWSNMSVDNILHVGKISAVTTAGTSKLVIFAS